MKWTQFTDCDKWGAIMINDEEIVNICYKCKRRILTNLVRVEIFYDNPEKGSHRFLNHYHKGCLLQLRSLARKLSNIREFDFNNSNDIEILSWSYFKALFLGTPLYPIFDDKTKAKIIIYGFEKELGFPIEMELKGWPNFNFK